MQTILVIAPHPDDEILGCGGLIAKHAAAGDKVIVLVVTKGIPELFPPNVIAQTRAELRQAHSLLGVNDVIFLDYPAPKLDTIPGYQLAQSIAEIIFESTPSLLCIPHHGDIHTDHQAVYQAAIVAARPIQGCSVKKILAYETLSETEWAPSNAGSMFSPNTFYNISEFLEVKLMAMSKIVSQLKDIPHPRSLRTIEALARFRGASVGVHAAEAFTLVREIVE